MIHECAVEPRCLTRWRDFRYLSEKFGISRGRLIARCPSKWEKMVYDGLEDCPEVEKARITERLIQLKSCMLTRHHHWSGGTWLENAIQEHSEKPFRAILAESNPTGHAQVLRCAELDELHPLWRAETQRLVDRRPTPMAECAAPLLKIANKVRFIDPYFEPDSRRYQLPLIAFLDSALTARSKDRPLRCIEYHTASSEPADAFDARCLAELPRVLPHGVSMWVVRWNKPMHNRYILTDRGGISFSHGLCDDGRACEPPQTDLAALLEEPVHTALWNEYDSSGSNRDAKAKRTQVVGNRELCARL